LKVHRTKRLEPALARNGGRLVKLTGDGVLAEFPSAVDALDAAISISQLNAGAACVDDNIQLSSPQAAVHPVRDSSDGEGEAFHRPRRARDRGDKTAGGLNLADGQRELHTKV
jgi:class 3 adenylate cyclase